MAILLSNIKKDDRKAVAYEKRFWDFFQSCLAVAIAVFALVKDYFDQFYIFLFFYDESLRSVPHWDILDTLTKTKFYSIQSCKRANQNVEGGEGHEQHIHR